MNQIIIKHSQVFEFMDITTLTGHRDKPGHLRDMSRWTRRGTYGTHPFRGVPMSRCLEQIKEILTIKNANGRRVSACSTINRTSPEIPMAQLTLIPHKVATALLPQRVTRGHVDAAAMRKGAGKKVGHYFENKRTKAFLQEVSTDMQICISELIVIVKGGRGVQGTSLNQDPAPGTQRREEAGGRGRSM